MQRVSVIISVYNRFELTKLAVDSALHQTLPVSEVILVDDGSFDGTSESLRQHIADNPAWKGRVRYFCQLNQGQSVARNRGIAEATGDWIAFVDNDDRWLPQKLEWQFRAIDQSGDRCGACFTDAWFMNNPRMKMTLFDLAGKRHDEPIGVIDDARTYLLDRRAFGRVPSVWVQTLIVRTDLARRLGGFDPDLRYNEEVDFIFRLACETSFCFVSMPMVLIDRRSEKERHIGESRNWDNADFRLRTTQRRLEKCLRLIGSAPLEIQQVARRQLAAVHSEWANWHLSQGRCHDAKKAMREAARVHLTWRIALKWAVMSCAPTMVSQTALARFRYRSRLRHEQGSTGRTADLVLREQENCSEPEGVSDRR